MTDGPQQVPTPRYEWERVVRRIVMPGKQKLMALVLATYADPDGSRVRPGNEILAHVTGQSERSVKRLVAALRGLGLLAVSRRGGGRSGAGKTTEYQLTVPEDLLDRVELLGPGDRPDSGVSIVAPQSGESSVDNPVYEPPVDNESEAAQVAHENDFQGPEPGTQDPIEGPKRTIEGPPRWPTTNTHPPTTNRPTLVVTTQGESRASPPTIHKPPSIPASRRQHERQVLVRAPQR